MRRILMVLLTTVLILVAVIFLITQGGAVATVIQRGQGVITLILALLQLAGIALGLALFVFILVQYAQFILPRRFIFQGFSNLSKLIEAEKMPLDLDMLAQEELVYQFKVLYSEWKKYSGDVNPDNDALLTDEQFFKKIPSAQNIKQYLSLELIKDNGVLDDLKEVINTLKDSEDINLMNLAGEIAPKEVTPIMKFIEAIFPPHTIRATGHLQWSSKKPGKAGITFEFVDLGSRRNLMVRTIWRSLKKKEVSTDEQPSSWSSTEDKVSANEDQSNQKQATLPGDDEITLAAERYIKLLSPAMHWLALMFWEQRMIANIPPMNYIRRNREKKRKAQVLYVLGALYYAGANEFPAYNDFFCQLAIEHFRKASTVDSSWCLPDLYLATLYSFKMQESQDDKVQRQQLQEEALCLYSDVLERVEKGGDEYTLQRVLVAKVWAELVTGDDGLANIACGEVERLEKLGPANYKPQRSDCGSYLYNLAVCYILARSSNANFIDTWKKARRTLAYCLVRAWDLKDTINQNLEHSPPDREFLKLLEQVLDKKQDKLSQLSELTGKSFEAEIDMILQEVEQLENQINCNVDRG